MNKFITIEGTDGSGKTTIVNHLKDYLESKGYEVEITREPGGVDVSEKIRNILLFENIDKKTEVLLFAASRREHILKKIIPALEQNKIVISDRFLDSSIAYQAYGRGLEEKDIILINNYILDSIEPDITFYLDVDVERGLTRTKGRLENNNLDKESINFYNNVKQGYENIVKNNKSRVIKIDANKDIETVKNKVINEIERLL